MYMLIKDPLIPIYSPFLDIEKNLFGIESIDVKIGNSRDNYIILI